jgi:serine/threonine protein kinase
VTTVARLERPALAHPSLASARPRASALEGLRWRPLQRLGAGGMGEVWEVEHVELGRRAALKVLHPEHRERVELAERLRDEARALARMRHRAIPDVLDLGELTDGRPFFVMQLIRGRDLRAELTRLGVIAVPTAVRWLAEVLDALEVVHEAGFVHRDVKLENVVVDEAGAPSIIDFGVAFHVEAALRRTGRGRVVGTPRTMSPEQHALIDVDHRADLYGVGLCLFELLGGRGPFDAEQPTAAAMLHAHCRRTPPRLGDVAPQLVPRDVEDVVARALAKSPDDRFRSAAEMRAALLAAGSTPSARRPPCHGLPATQLSPSPLRAILGSFADEAPSSSTRVLSSADLEGVSVLPHSHGVPRV